MGRGSALEATSRSPCWHSEALGEGGAHPLRAERALRPDQAAALQRELAGRDVEDALAALRDYVWQSPEAERRYDEALAVLSAG